MCYDGKKVENAKGGNATPNIGSQPNAGLNIFMHVLYLH